MMSRTVLLGILSLAAALVILSNRLEAGRKCMLFGAIVFLTVFLWVAWGVIDFAWGIRQDYRAMLREDRFRHGMCRCCGYDLRASTERCPECGTEMALVDPEGT